jgi:hypothetical protein
VSERFGDTRVASFPSKETLRAFIAKEYGGEPPELVWVSPATEPDSGVDYRYSDGSIINQVRSRFTWYAPDQSAAAFYAALAERESWNPVR